MLKSNYRIIESKQIDAGSRAHASQNKLIVKRRFPWNLESGNQMIEYIIQMTVLRVRTDKKVYYTRHVDDRYVKSNALSYREAEGDTEKSQLFVTHSPISIWFRTKKFDET